MTNMEEKQQGDCRMKRDYLHITDFNTEEILETLALSCEIKAKLKNREDYKPFKDHSLAMIFAKPSARTRVSFETGFYRLGGHALYLGPTDIQIGRREAVKDIARVLSRYNDIIMARLFDHAHLLELAEYATVPVINGLTDYNHPVQIMADIFTIREHRGHLDNLKIVYVGDGNNVAHSWIKMAARLPFHLVIACPEGYLPSGETVRLAKKAGISTIEIAHDPQTAVKGADIVYTDVWASMGQESELADRIERFKGFQVNDELLAATGKTSHFMHPLPAKRGLEVSDEMLEAHAQIIFDQAENRMHVQNAIMLKIAGKR